MITAIPVQANGRLASHFSQASHFYCYNLAGQRIAEWPTPLRDGVCEEKRHLLALFTQHQVSQVLLCRVGARMLNKLLQASLKVFRPAARGGDELAAVLADAPNWLAITRLEQASHAGQKSPKKSATCCHGKHKHLGTAAHPQQACCHTHLPESTEPHHQPGAKLEQVCGGGRGGRGRRCQG